MLNKYALNGEIIMKIKNLHNKMNNRKKITFEH